MATKKNSRRKVRTLPTPKGVKVHCPSCGDTFMRYAHRRRGLRSDREHTWCYECVDVWANAFNAALTGSAGGTSPRDIVKDAEEIADAALVIWLARVRPIYRVKKSRGRRAAA